MTQNILTMNLRFGKIQDKYIVIYVNNLNRRVKHSTKKELSQNH